MPLDFRYHLASLTAVFGALVIGLLLGVAMKEGPGLNKQIADLQADFKRAEALRDIGRRADDFNARLFPLIAHDRLNWRNIALVQNAVGFPENQVSQVRQALEQAGATVTVEINIKPALMQLTPEQTTSIYQRMGVAVPKRRVVDDLTYRLATDMGKGETPIAQLLQDEKLIRIEGNINTSVSTVVFLGGASSFSPASLRMIDLPFLNGCMKRQFRVAAVEPLTVDRSAISEYRKRGVPLTIDNIDRAAGRIALILALSNGQRGHYGYKDTADEVIPDTE